MPQVILEVILERMSQEYTTAISSRPGLDEFILGLMASPTTHANDMSHIRPHNSHEHLTSDCWTAHTSCSRVLTYLPMKHRKLGAAATELLSILLSRHILSHHYQLKFTP